MIEFGIIKEGKKPVDERVPLTPAQIKALFDDGICKVTVQRSDVRRISDQEFEALGIPMTTGVPEAHILLGVKEVPAEELVAGRTYLFFSHTIKMQSYNRDLLRAVLDKGVRLIDWECLRDAMGRRLIGFGRHAGVVGAYNGFRAYGLREGRFSLKKAHACEDRREMEAELRKIELPAIRILLTGRGKVAKGAMEILDRIGIHKVSIREFLGGEFDHPVYTQITFLEYFKPVDGGKFNVRDFYANPGRYRSNFMRYARVTDMLITGHYWDSRAPFLFTREDARHADFNIRVVADISCDIDGPIACTLRPTTIEDPFYGYDPVSEEEVEHDAPGCITVMAVDNLPCELPRDASHEFGSMFIRSVLPSFVNRDKHNILKNATIAEHGKITEAYAPLRKWVGQEG